MRMGKVAKQESSIPVQSRVSFMSLAKLHVYWSLEGYSIRTMSQLVSWSVDLLCEVLEANEKMPAHIETLAEAHSYLMAQGIYQKSMQGRAFKKIGTALKFETMRNQGQDPHIAMPRQHSIMHGRTAEIPDNVVSAGGMSDEEWEEIQRKIRKENEKDRIALVKTATETAKAAGLIVSEPEPERLSQEEVRAKYFKERRMIEAGEIDEEKPESESVDIKVSSAKGMSDEEYEAKMEEIKKRDKVRLELENAPFETSDLDTVKDENSKG